MGTIDNAINSINEYLHGRLSKPLFVAVNTATGYLQLRNALRDSFEIKQLSDFCVNQDDSPDCDSFVNYIKTLKGNVTILGVGEHLSFFDCDLIERLKDIPLNDSKAVIICRYINSKFSRLKADPRFRDAQFIDIDTEEMLPQIIKVDGGLTLPETIKGYKNLLHCLEKGEFSNIIVSTSQKIAVPLIKTSYECIKFYNADFNLSEYFGGESEWSELLNETINGKSLKNLLAISNYNIDNIANLTGYQLFKLFLALKSKDNLPGYLKFVIEKTNYYGELKHNILLSILDISETSNEFCDYYDERKKYLTSFTEADLALFAAEAKIKGKKRIFYLTDIKHIERQAIIECLATYEYDFKILGTIYPDLYAYINIYEFRTILGEELTRYFNQYKKIKITNLLNDDFVNSVLENAKPPRKYNMIPTRNKIFDSIEKKNAMLFYIDGMGVEYISFIKDYAIRNELNIKINIAIANLPSITSLNKDFYEGWRGRKYKTRDLDTLKHDGEDGFDYTQTKLPIHLEKELEIIKEVLDRAKAELFERKSDRAIISSDHGASRLCVLNGQEISEETDNKGEYSGRCCAYTDTIKIDNATEENGYLVLADYGRFKGSRAAQVEVHGGATWEEVIVPIIELSLKNSAVEIKLNDTVIYASFRKKPTITIFSTSVLQNVSVVLNNKTYYAESIDENNHKIVFDNLRAETHEADVFAGDNYCGKIVFTVKKEGGGEKELF